MNATARSQLLSEARLYYLLQGVPGVPRIHWSGTEGSLNVMVIELLGPNIEELVEFCGGTLSVPTTVSLALQFIARIEHLHSKYFVHRDIKPDNFAVGRGAASRTAYLIDYGLAKRYRDPTTKMHVPYKDNKRLTGTARYASINTHMGIEQSRRDDLECLGFTLIYMLKGKLPWQGIRVSDKNERYRKIYETKKTTPIDVLCKGLPEEFANLFTYCRSLNFEDKPDYAKLAKSFRDLLCVQGHSKKFDYDWAVHKVDLDHLLDRECSEEQSEESKKQEAEDEEVKEDLERKNTLLTKYTSTPNQSKSYFVRPGKGQRFKVTENIKKLKQGFLLMASKGCKEDFDEIPDEGPCVANNVKEFNFVVGGNCLKRRKNRLAKMLNKSNMNDMEEVKYKKIAENDRIVRQQSLPSRLIFRRNFDRSNK